MSVKGAAVGHYQRAQQQRATLLALVACAFLLASRPQLGIVQLPLGGLKELQLGSNGAANAAAEAAAAAPAAACSGQFDPLRRADVAPLLQAGCRLYRRACVDQGGLVLFNDSSFSPTKPGAWQAARYEPKGQYNFPWPAWQDGIKNLVSAGAALCTLCSAGSCAALDDGGCCDRSCAGCPLLTPEPKLSVDKQLSAPPCALCLLSHSAPVRSHSRGRPRCWCGQPARWSPPLTSRQGTF